LTPNARVVTVYVQIAIPPDHRAGHIEWPTFAPDPALSFATVHSAE
jgi:hypothetical protein